MLNARRTITLGPRMKRRFSLSALLGCLSVLAGMAGTLISANAAQAQLPPLPRERVVQVLGQHIHYYEEGKGDDVILLHGLGASAEIWAASIPALSAHYHVVVPDQIGFGKSDKPLIEYKIQTWVEFLDGFMQAVGIHKATVVGNSLGGWIAVDFARQHPDKVTHLILADSAGWRPIDMPAPIAASLNNPTEAGIRQILETMFYERRAMPVNLNPGSLEETRKLLEFIVSNKQLVTDQMVEQEFERHLRIGDGYTVQRFIAGSIAEDQFENEKLKGLSMPTLIIWGKDDHLFSLEQAHSFNNAISGSKLVTIDQCGHVPELEKAEDFDKAVLEFLGGS